MESDQSDSLERSEVNSHLENWYQTVANGAIALADGITDFPPDIEDAEELLDRYLGKRDLIGAFGGGDSTERPSADNDSSALFRAMWGRRCSYYLSALSAGLSMHLQRNPDPDRSILSERISHHARKLFSRFRRETRTGNTLWRSVEDEHGLVNHTITYLDPVLFSSLVALQRLGDTYDAARAESDAYQDYGVTEDNFDSLRKSLIEQVGDEVALYTKDEKKSDILADESTLWWGVYELFRFFGAAFRWPGSEQKGVSAAVDSFSDLVKWAREGQLYPERSMARSEATGEIHGELRTKLQIARNATVSYKLLLEQGANESSLQFLKGFTGWQLEQALNTWKSETHLQSHAYFIGLSLEILCLYQSVFGDFEERTEVAVERLEDHPDISAFEGKKRYVVWWHPSGNQLLTAFTLELDKKKQSMEFDLEVDESVGLININTDSPVRTESIRNYRSMVLPVLWLCLKHIDHPYGFGRQDILDERKNPKREVGAHAHLKHVEALRKFLGESLEAAMLPDLETPYRPSSEKFSCCWILESDDVEASRLRIYRSNKPLEK